MRLVPGHWAMKFLFNLSQLPGEYTTLKAFSNTISTLYPHSYQFAPHVHAYKKHSKTSSPRTQVSWPGFKPSSTRTWIWSSKPLCHYTLIWWVRFVSIGKNNSCWVMLQCSLCPLVLVHQPKVWRLILCKIPSQDQVICHLCTDFLKFTGNSPSWVHIFPKHTPSEGATFTSSTPPQSQK